MPQNVGKSPQHIICTTNPKLQRMQPSDRVTVVTAAETPFRHRAWQTSNRLDPKRHSHNTLSVGLALGAGTVAYLHTAPLAVLDNPRMSLNVL
jgi:hypothetical protein